MLTSECDMADEIMQMCSSAGYLHTLHPLPTRRYQWRKGSVEKKEGLSMGHSR